MDGVTVREYGLLFVTECLKKYLGDSWPVLLIFLAGIAVSAVFVRKNKKRTAPLEVVTVSGSRQRISYTDAGGAPDRGGISVTWMFLAIILMCAFTVCNPFLVRAVIPKTGMTTTYYRFFWVLPITLGAAYYLAGLVSAFKKRFVSLLAFIITAGALALVMPVNPSIKNLRIPDNVYKVDGAIPVLCEAVHEDFEKTETYAKAEENLSKITDTDSKKWLRALQRTYPVCVFPYQIEFAVRQYDPTVRLLFNRNLRLYYEGNRSTGITYSENNRRYQRRALILDAMYGRDESITADEFTAAMDKTKTRYLIVEQTRANDSFLTRGGCALVSVTAGYNVYRYGD